MQDKGYIIRGIKLHEREITCVMGEVRMSWIPDGEVGWREFKTKGCTRRSRRGRRGCNHHGTEWGRRLHGRGDYGDVVCVTVVGGGLEKDRAVESGVRVDTRASCGGVR